MATTSQDITVTAAQQAVSDLTTKLNADQAILAQAQKDFQSANTPENLALYGKAFQNAQQTVNTDQVNLTQAQQALLTAQQVAQQSPAQQQALAQINYAGVATIYWVIGGVVILLIIGVMIVYFKRKKIATS